MPLARQSVPTLATAEPVFLDRADQLDGVALIEHTKGMMRGAGGGDREEGSACQ